jgi:hypothetical protein
VNLARSSLLAPVKALSEVGVSRPAAVGATGFEPATFRPPAKRVHVSMCLGAPAVSYVSRAVDDLDR